MTTDTDKLALVLAFLDRVDAECKADRATLDAKTESSWDSDAEAWQLENESRQSLINALFEILRPQA